MLTIGRIGEEQPKLTGTRRFAFKRKEIGGLVNVNAVYTAKKIAPLLGFGSRNYLKNRILVQDRDGASFSSIAGFPV